MKSYEEICKVFDELFMKYHECCSEENRLAFRTELTAHLEVNGWTDDSFEKEMIKRLDEQEKKTS